MLNQQVPLSRFAICVTAAMLLAYGLWFFGQSNAVVSNAFLVLVWTCQAVALHLAGLSSLPRPRFRVLLASVLMTLAVFVAGSVAVFSGFVAHSVLDWGAPVLAFAIVMAPLLWGVWRVCGSQNAAF